MDIIIYRCANNNNNNKPLFRLEIKIAKEMLISRKSAKEVHVVHIALSIIRKASIICCLIYWIHAC